LSVIANKDDPKIQSVIQCFKRKEEALKEQVRNKEAILEQRRSEL